MDQHLSWGKAYIISAAMHLVLFILLALGLAVVVAEKEQQVYEIDLQASDFSQTNEHEGGQSRSSEDLFPEPLKAEEVARRVESVQQTVPPITPVTPTDAPTPTPEPDAASIPAPASSSPRRDTSPLPSADAGAASGASNTSSAGTSSGTSQSIGEDAGQEAGSADDTGVDDAPFDKDGFWAAVNANKEYPYMAMRRGLEGTTTIITTISPSGAVTDVSISVSSGYGMLDDAAVAAAYSVGSYPNPTGKTMSVETDVTFRLQ